MADRGKCIVLEHRKEKKKEKEKRQDYKGCDFTNLWLC